MHERPYNRRAMRPMLLLLIASLASCGGARPNATPTPAPIAETCATRIPSHPTDDAGLVSPVPVPGALALPPGLPLAVPRSTILVHVEFLLRPRPGSRSARPPSDRGGARSRHRRGGPPRVHRPSRPLHRPRRERRARRGTRPPGTRAGLRQGPLLRGLRPGGEGHRQGPAPSRCRLQASLLRGPHRRHEGLRDQDTRRLPHGRRHADAARRARRSIPRRPSID